MEDAAVQQAGIRETWTAGLEVLLGVIGDAYSLETMTFVVYSEIYKITIGPNSLSLDLSSYRLYSHKNAPRWVWILKLMDLRVIT